MQILFDSSRFRFKAKPSPYLREEVFVSPYDIQKHGIRFNGFFGLLSLEPLYPGPAAEVFPVHVVEERSLEPGGLLINQQFLEQIGITEDEQRDWSITYVPTTLTLSQINLEIVVESGNLGRELENLKKEKNNYFVNRCLLLEPGTTIRDLSLPVAGKGYFNIRSIAPALNPVNQPAIATIGEQTVINLFVPHRKSGVDMVILVDGSGSMNLEDYETENRRVLTRLEGARLALDVLLQKRLLAGSRVSRIACVVFGTNAKMVYPPGNTAMVELNSEMQIGEIQQSTRNLSLVGLEKLALDRSQTNITLGMRYAADLLDMYYQEGNEKMIVLLSDGAEWKEQGDDNDEASLVGTMVDPAAFADSLYYHSQIRIHTIAISDEKALGKYFPQYLNEGWALPNKLLLNKIASYSEGLAFNSPDARTLSRLLDEIGEGTTYPL